MVPTKFDVGESRIKEKGLLHEVDHSWIGKLQLKTQPKYIVLVQKSLHHSLQGDMFFFFFFFKLINLFICSEFCHTLE